MWRGTTHVQSYEATRATWRQARADAVAHAERAATPPAPAQASGRFPAAVPHPGSPEDRQARQAAGRPPPAEIRYQSIDYRVFNRADRSGGRAVEIWNGDQLAEVIPVRHGDGDAEEGHAVERVRERMRTAQSERDRANVALAAAAAATRPTPPPPRPTPRDMTENEAIAAAERGPRPTPPPPRPTPPPPRPTPPPPPRPRGAPYATRPSGSEVHLTTRDGLAYYEVWHGDRMLGQFRASRTSAGAASRSAFQLADQRQGDPLRGPPLPTPSPGPTHLADGTPRDDLSIYHFNGRYHVIDDFNGILDVSTPTMFGRSMSPHEVAALSGAPDGARVTLSGAGTHITLIITHPLYDRPSVREIYYTSNKTVIQNSILRIKPDAPQGFGTHVIASQVRAARAAGVKELHTNAAGSPHDRAWNGYYTWPRTGYVAPLSATQRTLARHAGFTLGDSATTADLMRQPGGAEWWRKSGTGGDMTFDLADDSVSMQVHTDYLREKNVTA